MELSSAMAGTDGRRETFGMCGHMYPVFHHCFELHFFYFLGFNIWKSSVICVIWKSSFIFSNINKNFLLHGLLMLLFSPYPLPCSKLNFIGWANLPEISLMLRLESKEMGLKATVR